MTVDAARLACDEAADPAPVAFNAFAPGFRENPYELYRLLRERDPVHRGPGFWVVTRYVDVRQILTDLRFSSRQIPDLVAESSRKVGGRSYDLFEQLGDSAIVFTDRPAHTRLRRLVGRAFQGARIAGLREYARETADALIATLPASGHIEFMSEIAEKLPLRIMLHLMDLPEELGPRILQSTHDIRYLLEPSLVSRRRLERIYQALASYTDFFRTIVLERQQRPGDDLISALILAQHEGDRLSVEEVIYACIMSFVAGHETTKCLMGNGLLALIDHPDQQELLRSRPEGMAAAVDEMMRYDAPLQQTQRKATQDVDVGGRTILAGDAVLLCLAAANRDPEKFADPDRFDITRHCADHLAFGYGVHGCIGGPLARIEVEALFSVLLERWRNLRREPSPLDWLDHSFILRGLKTLPLLYGN